MMDLTQRLEVGDLLIVETGEYSDSRWDGPVRVLVAATKQELADAFREHWKSTEACRQWGDVPDPHEFLPWLVSSGVVEYVGASSWHVGSYGEFEP